MSAAQRLQRVFAIEIDPVARCPGRLPLQPALL
jgi:hypothetical protein